MISALPSVVNIAQRAPSAHANASDRADDTGHGIPRGAGGKPNPDTSAQAAAELAATDRRVRAHEAAHLAAAGGLAQGGANFQTERGPNGKLYAVAGEVSIDLSPGRTPEETLSRAEQVRRAALAPADPSAQDYRVAAQAAQMMAEAQRELITQRTDAQGSTGAAPDPSRRAIDAYTRSAGDTVGRFNLFA
ncbi:hypothetical protein G3580_09275 [Nitrogeniibacter mangrovi]|uniref:SprA-related family protein n=1 Tax=Nitrogeniibacter mangrovi TaxID=2016596 RepID=A0A6C1BBX5_9RHOO|nr:putative metalloprotease CJM1_0395 family protein [Nitrogeniibacter mangrovi]QID19784.1 hypothetical protein G3580_09275 [Nitrogeniibacter mangrovi]